MRKMSVRNDKQGVVLLTPALLVESLFGAGVFLSGTVG